MKCEMCGGADPEVTVVLPVKHGKNYNTLACESCAEKTELYCQKHQRPHLGFEDETTACVECIEEIVLQDGEKIAGMFAAAVSRSEKAAEVQEAIENWFGGVAQHLPHIELDELPLAVRFLEASRAQNIARLVVTVSQRQKISPQEVIEKTAKEGAGVILGRSL